MKINSNTFSFDKKSVEYKELEDFIIKIASANGIENVEAVQASISKEEGVLVFREAFEVSDLWDRRRKYLPKKNNKNNETVNDEATTTSTESNETILAN
jgi:hypothetical protein